MKFKKCTSLFLALLLLVSNAGFAINVHYCAGKIAAITSVFQNNEVCKMPVIIEKPCCAKEVVETKKSCCSDKVFNFKGKSNEVIIKAFSFQMDAQFLISPPISPIFTPISITEIQQATAYYCEANAPPLFKLYSQYIFYA